MEIALGNGQVALIDDEDWFAVRCNYRKDGTVDRVSASELSWYVHDDKKGNIEVWSCYRRNGGKSGYSIRLHRLIMECAIGMTVDHLNGNKLDNRRCNLIVRSRSARPHRISRTKKSSPYKGVSRDKKRYVAKIRNRDIAYCDTALEAAFVYDDAAREEYGEYARLNFPERKAGQRVLSRITARFSLMSYNTVVYRNDGTLAIEIGNGLHAVIDQRDWTARRRCFWQDGASVEFSPSDLTWTSRPSRGGRIYVTALMRGEKIRTMPLHRLITECPPGFVVDHIDGNPLNNTQANLRICTNAENLKNCRKRKKTAHKFKGVHRLGSAKHVRPRYSFTIASDNRIYRGRSYQTKLEAALAYDDAAIKLHGEFACLNFPERHRAKAIA